LAVIKCCQGFGPTAILSDGDAVFQPRKVERSGLAAAVEGHVLIYIHKEQVLDDVEQRYPAEHYVLVDDKPRIAAAVKAQWRGRVTTILPQQGHYALDSEAATRFPPADIIIERIGDLLKLDLQTVCRCGKNRWRNKTSVLESNLTMEQREQA
jgi:FMN phosphatase YigB (HAD superfamily)